jgi:pyruvate dehydrogenase kinase 2/3/4
MLFELLKNSMRAVVELHGDKVNDLPTIRVVISKGHEDVTIKISDEGGGIPRSGISRIWTYQYTTAARQTIRPSSIYYNDFHAPMAGLGYGLPLSRLYARYFGGDLQIISMEGYGTDAYLHLRRLGDTEESLPRKLH